MIKGSIEIEAYGLMEKARDVFETLEKMPDVFYETQVIEKSETGEACVIAQVELFGQMWWISVACHDLMVYEVNADLCNYDPVNCTVKVSTQYDIPMGIMEAVAAAVSYNAEDFAKSVAQQNAAKAKAEGAE